MNNRVKQNKHGILRTAVSPNEHQLALTRHYTQNTYF
jgi:hypothetical protein